MTETTMTKRVARAMEARRAELIAKPLARIYDELARAAIAKMREPTGAMVEIGQDTFAESINIINGKPEPADEASHHVFVAMIDAALSEQQP